MFGLALALVVAAVMLVVQMLLMLLFGQTIPKEYAFLILTGLYGLNIIIIMLAYIVDIVEKGFLDTHSTLSSMFKELRYKS